MSFCGVTVTANKLANLPIYLCIIKYHVQSWAFSTKPMVQCKALSCTAAQLQPSARRRRAERQALETARRVG